MDYVYSILALGVTYAIIYVALSVKKYLEVKGDAVYDEKRSRKIVAVVNNINGVIEYAFQNKVRLDLSETNLEASMEEYLDAMRADFINGTIETVSIIINQDSKDFISKHLTADWDSWLKNQVELIASKVEENLIASEEAKETRNLMYGGKVPQGSIPMR